MPKLISFDIGIRNLAYCIFDLSNISILDWNVIDLSLTQTETDIKKDIINNKCTCLKKGKKEEKCLKKANYTNTGENSLFFCTKHANVSEYILPSKEFERNYLKKQSMNFLLEFQNKWKIEDTGDKKGEKIERLMKWVKSNVLIKINQDESKSKKSMDFIQIGRNMVEHLSKIDLEDIHYVIIENQISPIANKMRTIQGMLAQMFIINKIHTIEFISSSNKLREYLGEKKKKEMDINLNEEKIVNPDYKQHKKDGIIYSNEWLESSYFSHWKPFFNDFPKKQDDLADAFLQGIWYIRNKLGIVLKK
jgi:hypothetical protein